MDPPRPATDRPGSVLFCCDHNALRSPMAEGIAKMICGPGTYIQSAGVVHDVEIDAVAVAVCAEIGVMLTRHQVRSFEEMAARGETLEGFDLIVALSAEAARHARLLADAVEEWEIPPPVYPDGPGDAVLAAYRVTRDRLRDRIGARFGAGLPQGQG
ncbi:MAG: low molecular weight phosphatase family protein [Pseudomonadota bacterium]